jgi:hypothetical protein
VGHGLGVAPKMIIIKDRSNTRNWQVYHAGYGNTGSGQLNLTNAFSADGMFQNTTPTSSVFSVGTSVNVNASGANIIAYCFAPKKGFSAMGQYTGNNSNDGPFLYMGFKPAFVLIKATNTTQWWTLLDNKRDTYNVATLGISPNSSNTSGADDTSSDNDLDFLSNGFKWRTAYGWNASGIHTSTWHLQKTHLLLLLLYRLRLDKKVYYYSKSLV